MKISSFFKNEAVSRDVLKAYNDILEMNLSSAKLTPNVKPFLDFIKKLKINFFILSGGDLKEIEKILEINNLKSYFPLIYAGQNTKIESLSRIQLKRNNLYIGDSIVDYNAAKKFGIDFIFMYRYTQFLTWENFFSDKKEVKIIKDFSSFFN